MYADRVRRLAKLQVPSGIDADLKGYLGALTNEIMVAFGGCYDLTQDGTVTISDDFGQTTSTSNPATTGVLNVANNNNWGNGNALVVTGTTVLNPGPNDNSLDVRTSGGGTAFTIDTDGTGETFEPWNFNQGMQVGGDGVSTGNLLQNPGFENGLNDLDSPPDLWSGGGVADNNHTITANEGTWSMYPDSFRCYQTIDVSQYKTAIDAGNELVRLKAASYQSDDGSITVAAIGVVFTLNDNSQQQSSLTSTNNYYVRTKNFWRYYDGAITVPVGTRSLTFYIDKSGSANHVDECYMGLESVFDPDNQAAFVGNGNNIFNGDVWVNQVFGLGQNAGFVPNKDFVRQIRRMQGLGG